MINRQEREQSCNWSQCLKCGPRIGGLMGCIAWPIFPRGLNGVYEVDALTKRSNAKEIGNGRCHISQLTVTLRLAYPVNTFFVVDDLRRMIPGTECASK